MRGLLVWLLIAAIGLGGGRAHADDRAEARKAFAAAQEAERRKDWQGAIHHYLRANSLKAHPFAVYNVAVNYERLGKLREAAAWYERYLASITEPSERERVQREMDELVVRPAPLTVRSAPAGARVYIDAVPAGVTPHQGTIRGGFHRVSVDLGGGRRDQRDVTVEYAEPVTLDFALPDATGTIFVRGPQGAVIFIDEREAGRVPARLALAPGPHLVRVESPGYDRYETTVTVQRGREIKVTARMTRTDGADEGEGEIAGADTDEAGTGTGTGAGAGPGAGPGAIPATAPAVGPGTAPGASAASNPIRAGYLVGFAGGADARGGGVIGLAELGVRFGPLDGTVRVGRAAELTNVDILARWSLLPGRISPFLGGGYTFVEGGGGYAVSGGVRWDVVRADRGGLSVLAESGLRYFSATPESEAGGTPEKITRFIVPVMASLLYQYR